MTQKVSLLFEKFSAFVFLLLLVGMIMFLTYVPLGDGSKDAVMLIIGGLMTSATMALPKLFGVDDGEGDKLKERLRSLETKYETILARYEELKGEYDDIVKLLVDDYTENKKKKQATN